MSISATAARTARGRGAASCFTNSFTTLCRQHTCRCLLARHRDDHFTDLKQIMAARRTLGGGRVLGNANANLAPPTPSKHVRNNSGLLSPSESSVSLSSQTSGTPINDEDITSRVALHSSAQTAATTRMVCPICNEEMVHDCETKRMHC